jgi:hypothetical protein
MLLPEMIFPAKVLDHIAFLLTAFALPCWRRISSSAGIAASPLVDCRSACGRRNCSDLCASLPRRCFQPLGIGQTMKHCAPEMPARSRSGRERVAAPSSQGWTCASGPSTLKWIDEVTIRPASYFWGGQSSGRKLRAATTRIQGRRAE